MDRFPHRITLLVVALALAAQRRDGMHPPVAAPARAITFVPAPPGTAQFPGQVIDLANWYLTLPTGERDQPDDVHQPELNTFTDRWFRLDDTRDGVVFTANAGGVTTKNSSYPRSELREMNGPEKAGWSNTTGTHTLRLRQAVTQLPTVKPHVVTAQIHDAEDDVIEVRLEGEQSAGRVRRRRQRGHPRSRLRARHPLRPRDHRRRRPHPGLLQRHPEGRHRQERVGLVFQDRQLRPVQPVPRRPPDAVGQVVLYSLDVQHAPDPKAVGHRAR